MAGIGMQRIAYRRRLDFATLIYFLLRLVATESPKCDWEIPMWVVRFVLLFDNNIIAGSRTGEANLAIGEFRDDKQDTRR